MGKELPMAREEEKGRPVLLVRASNGEFVSASFGRNKRTQEPATSSSSEDGEVKDTEAESKSTGKTKRADDSSSKPARRRRNNKDRKSDRGDERKDKPVRRSAEELGIVFPGSHCDDAELTPHYWKEVEKIDKGVLFQCQFCHKYLWLPSTWTDAGHLGNAIKRFGIERGYCYYINRYRAAKILIAKLQDLRRLETEITDEREFARLTDKILSEKEYDRKEAKE